MPRSAFSELEWNGKPVDELDHAELLQLCERLHGMVWDSAENFETLLRGRFVEAQPGREMH